MRLNGSIAGWFGIFVAMAIFALSACHRLPDGWEEGHRSPRKQEVFPFAGRVTIDGHAPSKSGTVFVMINTPADSRPSINRQFDTCDADGNFEFSTYSRGDGLPPGKYVITIAQLKPNEKSRLEFLGPDQLKNLYNDPQKNKGRSGFEIDHSAPGSREYHFDLKIEGIEPVKTTGPYALTELKL